ncbi:MAG: hypothetical protein WCJ66_11830 [Verrucomicrobiota bacterium]
MSPRILCVILISHGLLAAQELPATENSSAAAPAVTEPATDQTPLPSVPAVSEETGVVGPISDGTPCPPAPPKPLPPFKAKSTVVRLIDVIEPPPMSGLPPVTGTITQTVHLVEDPGLADPPPPLPALPITDPAVLARMAEFRAKYRETRLAFVSATVYDHARTFLRCYPNGGADKEVSGWSNLDFNHFSGFATFQVKGRDGEIRHYALLMGIGNTDTVRTGEWLAKHGKTYTPPEFPSLPDLATAGPSFVITDDGMTDKESMDLMEGMHELYRVEGTRMAAAHEARLIAYEQRKAFLLAHPPKPNNVTVLFWERAKPARHIPAVKTEGGAQ